METHEEAVPVSVAIGFENPSVMHALCVELDEFRTTMEFAHPIHVRAARAYQDQRGYNDVSEMLMAAITHATDTRHEHRALIGIGIVRGPLYVPCETSRIGRPLLFETLMLCAVDVRGPVTWAIPEDACPREAYEVYEETGKLFAALASRRGEVPKEHSALADAAMEAFLEHVRPLPPSFGVLRPLS